ncbi:MAG: alpha/beta hydrolase, partial [Gammaproteobacteria bacterium]|nr:alpha/beta hydrolase [Gammaproteobacteria bacterium]
VTPDTVTPGIVPRRPTDIRSTADDLKWEQMLLIPPRCHILVGNCREHRAGEVFVVDIERTHPPAPTEAPSLSCAAPDWFHQALAQPLQSRYVDHDGCTIHCLHWPQREARKDCPGLLFLHGGGAHANWWRFIAPFFTDRFEVAAMDLSGMGDSGTRPVYNASIRAAEIHATLQSLGFLDAARPRPLLVGHSFGGLTGTRYAQLHGQHLGGFVLLETPVRPANVARPAHVSAVNAPGLRLYPDYATALARFRLLPQQSCEHDYIVEHIARHSIRRLAQGWAWKFDPAALTSERHAEPFRDYLAQRRCRVAMVFGDKSALTSEDIVEHMSGLVGGSAPVVFIPEGQHHLMLDQPLAVVSTLRSIFECWRLSDD